MSTSNISIKGLASTRLKILRVDPRVFLGLLGGDGFKAIKNQIPQGTQVEKAAYSETWDQFYLVLSNEAWPEIKGEFVPYIEDPVAIRVPSFARSAVDFFNEALAVDGDAVRSLVRTKVPCNQAMLDHPTIVVRSADETGDVNRVGAIGLLNGLAAKLGNERIGYEIANDETQSILRFLVVESKD